jgi:hypothetical protein
MILHGIDQRKSGVGIPSTMQMTRQFGEDHFERRPYDAAHQMTATRRGVRSSKNGVRVHLWRGIVNRHVAEHREDLDLGVDRDLLILFGVPVEERDDRPRAPILASR